MKRIFPLQKENICINRSEDTFFLDYKHVTEIPVYPHPGSFGYIRKNHIHEGIDLYSENGDNVYSVEEGVVVNIIPFTGVIADSPWWNDTYSIMVEHKNFVINYGEVIPEKNIKVGDRVKAGDVIGKVMTVLLKDKGRPMSMLHLEMYKKGTIEPIKEWSLGQQQPEHLIDPTDYIKSLVI